MGEHEVAAMETSLPEEQPEASASGSGAACWGTCEELLLVSAVKRHGVNNWTEISAELKDRAISLNGSPLYFSEETCKHKYDSLRGRFASSSSSSMSRDEEMANGMHWIEELRKLRVAHLKRELEHYDGSIGSLQVKIKRLKAEKAQDTSVNKQLGKSIANSFPNDQVPATSSHEESVYCIPNDQELANDRLTYSALKVCSQHPQVCPTLASDTSMRLSESPAGLPQQVLSEGEQWHDAVEELHEASPITTDITVDTDVLKDDQTLDNCGGDNPLQHKELNEVAPMPIATTVTMDSFMSESFVESQVVELKTLVASREDSKDHSQSPYAELVDIQQQGSLVDEPAESLVKDNDAGRDVLLSSDDGKRLQLGESMHIKEEVAVEREESLEDTPRRAQAEAEIAKSERSATAISESDCASGMCIDIGIPSSPKTLVNDSMAIHPLFVSRLPSSDFGNAKEAVETEPEVTLLVDEEAQVLVPEQDGRLALDVDTTEYVTENLLSEVDRSSDKTTNLEGGFVTQAHVEIALEIVPEQGAGQPESFTVLHNEPLKEADEHDVRNTVEFEKLSTEVTPVPEGLDDVTRVTEPASVSSPSGKELPSEEFKMDKDVPIPTALTGVGTRDMESREATENSEMEASAACSPSQSGGLGISAVVPVADFVKNDSDVLRDGAIFILDKSETKGSARRSSGLLYLSEGISLDFKTNSPERHIVIALDEPNVITPLLKSTSVLADNFGANKNSSSIESEILCQGEVAHAGAEAHSPSKPDGDLGITNVTSVAPNSVSRRKTRSKSVAERESLFMDKKSQGNENAMDLLRMMYGSAQETAPESSLVSVEVKLKPEADNPAAASLSSVSAEMETSNPGGTPSNTLLPVDITAIVAEEPCNFDGETPSAKYMHFETDLGQPFQDVVAEETVVDVTTYLSSPENREIPDVGSRQAEAVDASGTNSNQCMHNLHGQESLPAELDPQVFQESNQQHIDNCKDVMDAGVIDVTPPLETPEISHLESEPVHIDRKDLNDVGIAHPKKWEEIAEIVLDVKLHIAKEEDLEDAMIQPSILREVEAARELVGSSLSSLEASQGIAQPISEVELRPTMVKSDTLERVKPNMEAEEMDIDKDGESKEDGPLPAMESAAEPSPVEYVAGGAESNRLPSSHEGSDSVHEQSKDGGDHDGEDEERRPRTRDYGESQVDKSEAGSPVDGLDDMSPSSRRNHKEPRVPGKLFPLLEVLRKVCNHKSAYLFKGREEDSRYNLLIRRHLDLTIVRTRLEEGSYSGSREFFRDLLLIFNNAMVYYSSGSSEFLSAKSLFAEATKEMERVFQTEALLKQDGPATRTRELKKPKPVVGAATPPKAGQSPVSAGGSSVKSVPPSPTVTSLPDIGCRRRAVSRLGPVETSTTSEALVDSEGGAARSASLNVVGGPSTSRAEEAEDSQDDDQEVNGRLKDTKKLQKGGVLIRGKPQREELLEGILLKNAANKGLGRVKLKDLKEEEVIKKSAVPTKTGAGKLRGERERERKREKEKETETEKGKERDEIDDDDLLRKGKSLAKLKDRDIVRKKDVETKPAPKARAFIAARPPSNSFDTLAQSLVRPVRGLRKPPSSNKESTRAPEHQAKKRVRK